MPTKNETTENGWKCTGGINAGQDSYRVYENSKTGETSVKDGKNENEHLKSLSSKDNENQRDKSSK